MNLKKMSKPNTKVTIDDILGPNINSNDTTIVNETSNNFKYNIIIKKPDFILKS